MSCDGVRPVAAQRYGACLLWSGRPLTRMCVWSGLLLCKLQDEAQLEDFQPHFKAVVQHLPQLQQILQLQPSAKVHQSSSSTPQPTVGSHRVWACGILHMLLLHNNVVIDRAIADAGLLPTVLAMAFRHGHCSAVQCRAVEMLRSSLRSSVPQLWQGLFTAGYGQELQQPGGSELLLPLHEALVQIGKDGLCCGHTRMVCLDCRMGNEAVSVETYCCAQRLQHMGGHTCLLPGGACLRVGVWPCTSACAVMILWRCTRQSAVAV